MSRECCARGQTSDCPSAVSRIEYVHWHVNAILRDLKHHKVCSLRVSCLQHTRTRSIACQYHWNMCNGTILSAMHFCSRVRWPKRRATSLSSPQENQEACNGDTPLHPHWQKLSQKYPPVKWYCVLWHPETWVLDFSSCNDTSKPTLTVKVFRSCIQKSRTHMVNSVTASCCYMAMPISMWAIVCTTNWMSYSGRCSNILHMGQTYCYMTLKFWNVKASPPRLYVHVGQWCVGGCGTVVKAVA